MAVIDVASWKVHRGYNGTDYDATVTALIPRVQAYIERFIGSALDRATHTDEEISGTGTAVMYTRNWPVESFTSLSERSGTTYSEVSSDSYRVPTGAHSIGKIAMDAQGIGYTTFEGTLTGVRQVPSFTAGRDNYKATYIAGYGAGGGGQIPFPPDLQLAAHLLVDHYLQDRGRNLAVASDAQGNQNTSFRTADERMREVHALLGPFRRVPL